MIRELWHLLPYIVFGASMGSSAVHFIRRQFPRQEEPPPFPKGNPIREIGEDPAVRLFVAMAKAQRSIMARQRRTTPAPSLILITMVAGVLISHIIERTRDR